MTLRLVLLGDPVEHSLSPVLHEAALAATGLVGTYTTRRVDEAGLRLAVEELRHGRLTGANVTMPHKVLAFELAERPTARALRIGAVNTLWRREGAVWADNTDVDGVLGAFAEAGLPEAAPILVLGGGGAAAAALVALADRQLHVATRRPEAARRLLDRLRVEGRVVEWGRPVPGAVVVNATPIGMRGEDGLPRGVLAEAAGLLDMAYGAGRTPAATRLLDAGVPVAEGPTMLVHQAAAAFERWTGREAPLAAMQRALRDTLGG
ncbi:MAG TPA: shikimate dehydrogenase [Actinobacteria bacterium]|nr:shikimate dehydrogenase [Actinomycetota bacterium]